jgi:hypothetical protein
MLGISIEDYRRYRVPAHKIAPRNSGAHGAVEALVAESRLLDLEEVIEDKALTLDVYLHKDSPLEARIQVLAILWQD